MMMPVERPRILQRVGRSLEAKLEPYGRGCSLFGQGLSCPDHPPGGILMAQWSVRHGGRAGRGRRAPVAAAAARALFAVLQHEAASPQAGAPARLEEAHARAPEATT